MLIRFIIENVFSFGDRKEFNTVPYSRLLTLENHKYNYGGIDFLKICSIYGANGAGKSNLIKALVHFENMVRHEKSPFKNRDTLFKLTSSPKTTQLYAIEFIQDDIPFYYAIVMDGDRIQTEELYITNGTNGEERLLFERITDKSETTLRFASEFDKDEKIQVLKTILIEEFIKPTELILKLLSNRDNPYFENIKKAYNWFDNTLQIISPESKPTGLTYQIEANPLFNTYAQGLINSLNLGICSLVAEEVDLDKMLGKENEKTYKDIIDEVDSSPENRIAVFDSNGDEVVFEKRDDKYFAKSLRASHSGCGESNVLLKINEESDGTIRLIDFIPALFDLVNNKKVYVIDEIERSIHPLLIKELVRKFAEDTETKGQLIFSTHESNLLDQDIFRQDEIWFAEKDMRGMSDLYSLSSYKEHKTIDIQKGYLKGKYGSIPFLGNLKDLNWHKHDNSK